MTLSIHRAERTDLLADGLAELLRTPLEDPFAREVVVVPARGVERWLTQRLSHRLGARERGGDGVCAGVDFRSPHSLVAMLLDRERDDPWDPDRLVWPLLRVIDASLGEPWCAALAAHLGHGDDGAELRRNRRYAVARRLAGHLMAYADQRPRLLTDWREGRDTDGAGGVADDDLRWQPELWRRLLGAVEAAPPDVRHAETVAALRSGGRGLDLPPRLSLFGHTRISATEAELLGALGEVRDVHLWLPQVSATLWSALRDLSTTGPVPRAEDPSADVVGHPLLAALGRDARELQRTLAPLGGVDEEVPLGSGRRSAGSTTAGGTLLGWLQHDLRANALPDAATRAARVRARTDLSVQVHACHGPARQVDVLREVLVGLLADDPTLEPRDILVMCPDIETYAPLVSAAFGMAEATPEGAGHPGHQLRVRLADRALSSTNPLLGLAATLVELAGGRLTATQVLDLAADSAVRARFGFSDDDLDRLHRWVADAGIRWGLDVVHRGRYGLRFEGNTWRAGLDRVLLGVAMSGDDHRFAGGVLPLDDVGSGDVDLAGRFAELLDRVHAFVTAAAEATTVGSWVEALGQGVGSLTRVAATEVWQVAQLDRELARIGAADEDGTALRLADVRRLLAQRLGGRPTRANFRTGTLTVCTMVPMRSVPHRVVALLGVDDGLFPRTATPDGDDVLARRALTGERDPRAEDRQLMLDAIMATRDTLVVTYSGAGEHSAGEKPPAVPLGELLDTLEVTAADGARGVVVRHPLQPFDARNLAPDALVPDRPFSFDRDALAGARVARETRVQVGPLVAEPLPPRPVAEVSLTDLKAFFDHPVRAFLRQRLDVSAVLSAEELDDGVPIDLGGLDKWAVGDRLVQDVLAGRSPQDGMTAELLRGLLPPGRLGVRQLRDICQVVQPIVSHAAEVRQGAGRSIDVDVEVAGTRVVGTVGPVFGSELVTVGYSSLGARQRFRAWVDLLALTVADPDRNWRSHAIGRFGRRAQRALAGPLDHRAEGWLADLVDLHHRGLREPLPIPPRTALRYAEESVQRRMGADVRPGERAAREWETDRFNDRGIPGEDADPWHVRAFGAGSPFECLTAPCRDDEQWDPDERHRLGQYAWRMWAPLLTGAEQVRSL